MLYNYTHIFDKENDYYFIYNLEISTLSHHIGSNTVETLGNRYPYVVYQGNRDYITGSLKCIFVDDSLGNINKRNEKELRHMPHGTGINDKIGKYAARIADLKGLLDLNLKKCFYELNRINRFIESVQDSEMRMILTLRYIQNFSWQKISFIIGYQDESVPRKRHDRFLRKTKMTEMSELKVLK